MKIVYETILRTVFNTLQLIFCNSCPSLGITAPPGGVRDRKAAVFGCFCRIRKDPRASEIIKNAKKRKNNLEKFGD